MGDTPLATLEENVKKLVEDNFSLKAIENKFEEHLKAIEEHKDEIVPKIKDIYSKMVEHFVELETETDLEKRTLIQRRLGSLKRAHLSYLKSMEQKALWQAANNIWDGIQTAKNFILALIQLVPV